MTPDEHLSVEEQALIAKGLADIDAGRVKSLDQVRAELRGQEVSGPDKHMNESCMTAPRVLFCVIAAIFWVGVFLGSFAGRQWSALDPDTWIHGQYPRPSHCWKSATA